MNKSNTAGRNIWSSVLLLVILGVSQNSKAEYNSANLTLKMTLGMATCDLSLMTPSTLLFPPLSSTDLAEEAGHVSAGGEQYISIVTQNCPGSGTSGVRPAMQIVGDVTATVNDRIFRDYSSTVGGNIGFGVRYIDPATSKPDITKGKDGGYLTNGDFIDLAGVGEPLANGNMTQFVVDVIHKPIGDTISSGTLKSVLRFQLIYH